MSLVTNEGRQEAKGVFRALPRMLNCAQSVAVLAGREELSDGLSGYGGGRAPEGLCGALHAALMCVPAGKREALLKEFEAEAGNVRCSDLKRENRFPCLDCVALSTALARKYSSEG